MLFGPSLSSPYDFLNLLTNCRRYKFFCLKQIRKAAILIIQNHAVRLALLCEKSRVGKENLTAFDHSLLRIIRVRDQLA
jgi:hypothetical protein